jgi:Tol biopolymer transport system component
MAILSGAGPLKKGSPLEQLPPHIEQLSWFGERADFSPDNKRVAFMSKSFGDAFEIDLGTRRTRCLTCSIPGAAFLRVQYLTNGDYLLNGPEKFKDIRTSRRQESELWILRKDGRLPLVRLNQRLSEGAAVSKRALRIAWSNTEGQYPEEIPKGHSRLYVADLDYSSGAPRLANKKQVAQSDSLACRIEAQDFYDNDTKLIYTCYRPGDKAEVMGLDLKTGLTTNFSQSSGTYNEPEGIFPDGQHTLVEADRQGNGAGSRYIDIWKLKLDGSGRNFERLTHFTDYEGYKSSNPVVSTDGKMMAFQVAMTKDEAGVGYGILLYHFEKKR